MSISELPWLPILRMGLLCVCVGLVGSCAYVLAAIPPLVSPRLGVRGRNRVLAREGASFRLLEPVGLTVGGWLRRLDLAVRAPLARLICTAGEPEGLEPDELLARCALSCLVVGGLGVWVLARARMDPGWQATLLVLTFAAPVLNVRASAKQRAKELERSLPSAMDLCALCMGAGADFPQALRFSIQDLGAAHVVCLDELGRVLDELSLGRTRVEALAAMGERTDSHAVKEFVSAICQSEEKGTPLVEALTIQASTLRQRRSVLAEEMAAKAAVKMMFPVMLMVAAILLIVVGPMIVNGTGL